MADRLSTLNASFRSKMVEESVDELLTTPREL
jgi:hypothetical protein